MTVHTDAQTCVLLLVEDSPSDILLTREALAVIPGSYTLYVVQDGVEALAFLRAEAAYRDTPRPQLVLLDWNLPKKHGSEVLSTLRADLDLYEIPVVVLTTSQNPRDTDAARMLEANGYFTKPTDFGDFVDLLQRILQSYCA
ncbi:MAG: response regulator [Candidatus Tectomicrobia bacterium]|uniref:Response regulator n=1 Tax=Tectimicrobiota bacterium TaxID=2528274 RepID=A0A937VZ18_UNCTE|nr:response regulator [Candidatus Tectomicrobia bacterium]